MAVIIVTTATSELSDHLDTAWGIIANAYRGDWTVDPEWQQAALRWRERYHELLDLHVDDRARWEQEVFGPF